MAYREEDAPLTRGKRIILDLSMAQGGGGFTYAVNVIPVLAERLAEAEICVLLRSRRVAEWLQESPNLKVRLLPEAGFLERLKFLAAGAPSFARTWGADLYYSASELSPFSCPCPKMAAFRNANLFTELRLGWPVAQRIRQWLLWLLASYSARSCERILFVSDDSASWIGDRIGMPREKRVTVPHGINASIWEGCKEGSPLDREFILSVSSVYRYKNFVNLIEAWKRVADRWPQLPDLVIVGDDQDALHSSQMRDARRSAGAHAERIHLVGEVKYAEMGRYYRNAKAFVFPSYLETFGHPLLEAMAAGLPVVASDLGVFREVGGDAAIYFSPHDVGSIADCIESVLRDTDRQREMVAKGFDRVEKYSWNRTVDLMITMFEEVLAEKAGIGESL